MHEQDGALACLLPRYMPWEYFGWHKVNFYRICLARLVSYIIKYNEGGWQRMHERWGRIEPWLLIRYRLSLIHNRHNCVFFSDGSMLGFFPLTPLLTPPTEALYANIVSQHQLALWSWMIFLLCQAKYSEHAQYFSKWWVGCTMYKLLSPHPRIILYWLAWFTWHVSKTSQHHVPKATKRWIKINGSQETSKLLWCCSSNHLIILTPVSHFDLPS